MCASVFVQAWLNGVGKAQKRKGKRLFMPMRIVLTGRMQVCWASLLQAGPSA